MENNQQKAHETAYGSSVISPQPLHAPSIMGGPTLPGTGQLCGPCKAGGWCPVHGGGAAGAPKVLIEGEARQPSPTEKLGAIVTTFLDGLVEHLAERVTAKVMQRVQQVIVDEIRSMPPDIDSQLWANPPLDGSALFDQLPFPEQRLHELADALRERGLEAFVAQSTVRELPGVVATSGLMVRWPLMTQSMYVRVTTTDGATFAVWNAEPANYSFTDVVDYFVKARAEVTDQG